MATGLKTPVETPQSDDDDDDKQVGPARKKF